MDRLQYNEIKKDLEDIKAILAMQQYTLYSAAEVRNFLHISRYKLVGLFDLFDLRQEGVPDPREVARKKVYTPEMIARIKRCLESAR